MRPSLVAAGKHIHKVSISFPNRRTSTAGRSPTASSQAQQPPTPILNNKKAVFSEFWQAPPRFWQSLPIEDAEIEAIESGGAMQ